MTTEEFDDKLAALITLARMGGLSDQDVIEIMRDATESLEEGLT